MEIFGHRGAAGLAPENTLAGLRRGAELGCFGVECDVRAVEDQLVLMHDASVDRTTSGSGLLAELGATRVRELDAGGEPVPWVSEVVPLLVEFPWLRCNLELKDTASVPLLAAELGRWPERVSERVLVSSFSQEVLSPWGGTRTPLALCAERLDRPTLESAVRLGCGAVHLALSGFHPEDPSAARAAGLAVRVFTVNDFATARQLASGGVSGVFSDRPDRVIVLPG